MVPKCRSFSHSLARGTAGRSGNFPRCRTTCHSPRGVGLAADRRRSRPVCRRRAAGSRQGGDGRRFGPRRANGRSIFSPRGRRRQPRCATRRPTPACSACRYSSIRRRAPSCTWPRIWPTPCSWPGARPRSAMPKSCASCIPTASPCAARGGSSSPIRPARTRGATSFTPPTTTRSPPTRWRGHPT